MSDQTEPEGDLGESMFRASVSEVSVSGSNDYDARGEAGGDQPEFALLV